ncbi:hypothetical protein [Spiroplasma sp. AdecLV25b]|nr:hypothetical protein [Spiroplasma sp. AdecLV25b]
MDFSTYRTYVLKSEEQIELIAKFISFTYENDPYLENKKLKKTTEIINLK